jgi:hypothetical protein
MQQPMPAKLTKHLAQVDRRNVLVFGDFLETTQSGIVLFSQIGQRSDPITCSLRENHPGLRSRLEISSGFQKRTSLSVMIIVLGFSIQ